MEVSSIKEELEDHFRGGTRLYTFWTPKAGSLKFKITVRLTPQDDVLRVRAYCEPGYSPRASVLAVDSGSVTFPVAGFEQAEFAEWLHARLQKCGDIGLAILRPRASAAAIQAANLPIAVRVGSF